ncbi:flagellar motor protein MotS [Oceanobacillus halotolerans]|uniref:flagellar motor protein MotS n=1 Tax=Oceanobacillus halotolerans TaxID=2663380 RepID=UPI0013DCD101|nr:flagellar motor protein MotS [Oceanobacillus halotolerans]
MKRRQIKKVKKTGAPKWMVTYSDMVTLILVFFVLLFSMSQIDIVKFEAISESFQNRMIFEFNSSAIPLEYTNNGAHTESERNTGEMKTPIEDARGSISDNGEDALSSLIEDIERFLDKNDLNDVVSANRTERGVVLVLQESILFETGEAEILDSGMPFLNRISDLLSEIPNDVKVEGHTDSRSISNYRYPSNWELSGARASSVIRYLIDTNDFDSSRFTSVGYGDTRPAVPNNSPENWQKNRRVEIVILDSNSTEE